MNDDEKSVLRQNRIALAQDIITTEKLLSQLMEAGLFDYDMIEIIKSEKEHDRVYKLLDLLPKRGPRAFSAFVQVLQKDYDWLAERLISCLQETTDKENCLEFETVHRKDVGCEARLDNPLHSTVVKDKLKTLYTKIHSGPNTDPWGAPTPPISPMTFNVVENEIEELLEKLAEKTNEILQCKTLFKDQDSKKSLYELIQNVNRRQHSLEKDLKEQKQNFEDVLSDLYEHDSKRQTVEKRNQNLKEEMETLKHEHEKLSQKCQTLEAEKVDLENKCQKLESDMQEKTQALEALETMKQTIKKGKGDSLKRKAKYDNVVNNRTRYNYPSKENRSPARTNGNQGKQESTTPRYMHPITRNLNKASQNPPPEAIPEDPEKAEEEMMDQSPPQESFLRRTTLTLDGPQTNPVPMLGGQRRSRPFGLPIFSPRKKRF